MSEYLSKTIATTVDPWGRVVLDMDGLSEILYSGLKIDDVLVSDGEETERFNRLCRQWDRPNYAVNTPAPIPHSPEEERARRVAQWPICEILHDLDVRAFLLDLCANDAQRARVNEEMDLYEERELLPLLKTMICLVDHFTTHNIVWGVGRGSSVASYVLYLIGIHRIDSMKFSLPITDFLK